MNVTPEMISFIVEGAKFLISVDPNKNGTPLLVLSLDLMEVPAELMALIKK